MARDHFAGALGSDDSELVIATHGRSIAVDWASEGQSRRLGDTASGRTIRQILNSAGDREARRRDAVLLLPAADVLRPSVRLPLAKDNILREALKYELEKLSPISPDEVYCDFEITRRDREANTADVALRIIRRDIVDEAWRACGAAELKVSAVRFEGDARPADPGVFPVDRAAALKSQWRRNATAFVCGGALALFAALLLATYLRGMMILDNVDDMVSDEGVRAARVEQLQQRIEHASAQLAFLGRQKRAPLFSAILADVTRALPDGTWIDQFDMNGPRIRISGYSRSASDLIAAFDRSGRFANAQFAAPVTQGAAQGVERFDLTFEIAK